MILFHSNIFYINFKDYCTKSSSTQTDLYKASNSHQPLLPPLNIQLHRTNNHLSNHNSQMSIAPYPMAKVTNLLFKINYECKIYLTTYSMMKKPNMLRKNLDPLLKKYTLYFSLSNRNDQE